MLYSIITELTLENIYTKLVCQGIFGQLLTC